MNNAKYSPNTSRRAILSPSTLPPKTTLLFKFCVTKNSSGWEYYVQAVIMSVERTKKGKLTAASLLMQHMLTHY
jgi:hypothetical protein